MTIKEALSLEPEQIMKLKKDELKKVVSTMASAANKRIKNLNKNNLSTPSLDSVNRSGGKFTTRNKNINQLRSEYSRVSAFLNAKTSTVKGAKKVIKDIEKRIGGHLKPHEMKNLWEAYRRIEELDPNFLKMYGSSQMQQYLRDEIVSGNNEISELINKGVMAINKNYEDQAVNYDEMDEFFEL